MQEKKSDIQMKGVSTILEKWNNKVRSVILGTAFILVSIILSGCALVYSERTKERTGTETHEFGFFGGVIPLYKGKLYVEPEQPKESKAREDVETVPKTEQTPGK